VVSEAEGASEAEAGEAAGAAGHREAGRKAVFFDGIYGIRGIKTKRNPGILISCLKNHYRRES
jgi:hypothetical protein